MAWREETLTPELAADLEDLANAVLQPTPRVESVSVSVRVPESVEELEPEKTADLVYSHGDDVAHMPNSVTEHDLSPPEAEGRSRRRAMQSNEIHQPQPGSDATPSNVRTPSNLVHGRRRHAVEELKLSHRSPEADRRELFENHKPSLEPQPRSAQVVEFSQRSKRLAQLSPAAPPLSAPRHHNYRHQGKLTSRVVDTHNLTGPPHFTPHASVHGQSVKDDGDSRVHREAAAVWIANQGWKESIVMCDVCVCVCARARAHTYMNVCVMCVCSCVQMCMCKCACAYEDIHEYAYACVHGRVYAYVYAHV